MINEIIKLSRGLADGFDQAVKFDEFIASVDKGIPSLRPLHTLVQDLLENKTLDLTVLLQNGDSHKTSLDTT
jgi:hypothetical protein